MKASRMILIAVLIGMTSGAWAVTVEMTVNGLVCGFCAQGIEKQLRRFPETAEVFVSLEQRLVAVGLREGTDIPDATLTKALEEAGYAVKAIKRTETPVVELRQRIEKAE